jgi:hypothetical protein
MDLWYACYEKQFESMKTYLNYVRNRAYRTKFRLEACEDWKVVQVMKNGD